MIVSEITKSCVEHAIDDVYRKLCEISNPFFWWNNTEVELLHALITCILGSRVSNEVALAAASKIEESGVIESACFRYLSDGFEDSVARILGHPLSGSCISRRGRYPFPNSRANYISRTVRSLYSGGESLRGLLNTSTTPQEARCWLINKSVGIGPKQASLFLRNIGFTNDLAILDSHVLRFMYLLGLVDHCVKSAPTIRVYEMYESIIQEYAFSSGRCMGQLDFAIWVVMRVFSAEIRQ